MIPLDAVRSGNPTKTEGWVRSLEMFNQLPFATQLVTVTLKKVKACPMRRHPWRRAQCGSLGDACMVDAITKSEWLLLERSNFWVDHHAHNLPSTIISQQATNKKRTSLNNTHKLPQQHATTAINKRNNTRQQLSATIITNYNPTQHASSIMHHLVYGWSTIIDMLDVLHALGSMSFLNISTGRWTFAWFSLCHRKICKHSFWEVYLCTYICVYMCIYIPR